MNPLELESPITDDGIRSVNFFNGRLLTAHDLRREQEARRAFDWRLGEAIGDGVVYGLEAAKHAESTEQNPLVTVKAGLALNRAGQALKLKSDATIALVRKSKLATAPESTFAQCGNLVSGAFVAGPGVYLLTIAPATQVEGKAKTNGLDLYGGRCNTDTVIETVQFRLISLETYLNSLDFGNEDKLRNETAYRFLDADRDLLAATNPLGGGQANTLEAQLHRGPLSACDIPLAVLYWTLSGGVRFVDNWSVRRRTRVSSIEQGWVALFTSEKIVLGEARMLQFREHVESWLDEGRTLSSLRARQALKYLPPVGLLPIGGNAGQSGIAIDTFFEGMTLSEPRFLEAASLEYLLRMGCLFPPVATAGSVHLRLYMIRENFQALSGPPSQRPQAAVVFASGHIPSVAPARFDVSEWDFGHYV